MSNHIKNTLLFLQFFTIWVAVCSVHNETSEFWSIQEVFVGEDAIFKFSFNEDLTNIADVRFGVVTRPAEYGTRHDAILIKPLPSGKLKWNLESSRYVKPYINRTMVIRSTIAAFKISNVQLNDSAEFYCSFKRISGDQKMVTSYMKLKVVDIKILNTTSSQDVISWKGHKIRLHCNIRIVPNTLKKFTWRNKAKSGTVVDPTKHHDTVNGSRLTVLTYNDTDFGPYECIARTAATEQRYVIRIQRIYEPSEPGNFSHHRKLTLNLNCSVVAKLSWMSPLKDGGAPVIKYIVEYKPFGKGWSKASRQKVNTNLIKICRPPRDQGGDGLQVRVKAKNKVGVGKPSQPTIVTFWDEPTVPRNLKSRLRRNLGNPFIELSWDYPIHDGGVRVTAYQVEYKPVGSAWINAAKIETVEKEINIWKTSQDEEIYQVRVRAINGVGFSDASSILKVAFAEVPSKPLQVTEKTVLHVTQEDPHIHIAWKRPLDNGGLTIIQYKIEYKKVTQEDWKLAKSDLVIKEKYVIKEVDENEAYQVRVSARNSMGFGSWSKIAVVKFKGSPLITLSRGDKTFVAFKARSQGSRLARINGRVLGLVFLLATFTIASPR